MIDSKSIVCQAKDIDGADLDGEKVMMNLEKGKYFCLNSVGSRIQDIIEEKVSVDKIIDILLEQYEIDRDTCEKSVINYLESLKNEELISVY